MRPRSCARPKIARMRARRGAMTRAWYRPRASAAVASCSIVPTSESRPGRETPVWKSVSSAIRSASGSGELSAAPATAAVSRASAARLALSGQRR